MTGFCTDSMTIDNALRPEHGVLRVTSLAVTADAREAAQRILEAARSQAEDILREAQQEARDRTQELERDTLERADRLLQGLEAAHGALLEQAQDIVVDLAQQVFARLVADMTPREKVAATCRKLLQEAPPRLANALLRVHPEDLALLPELEWEVKPDPTLARGSCRLEASSGEWCADFDAGVAVLKRVLADANGVQAPMRTNNIELNEGVKR